MLPPELATDRLRAIHDEIAASFDNFALTEPLNDEDALLLGRYVQLYNYIEFNLRRSLELFVRASVIPSRDRGKSIHEVSAARLVPLMKQGVAVIPSEAATLADTVGKLDELEFRRTYRNMFAHFVPRAYQDDFIVFLTRSDFDAQQVLGEPLGDDGVFLAVMERQSIRFLYQHIQPYEEWIARKVGEWRKALGIA